MLTIFPVKNADYYTEWTQTDYYLNNDELPGLWNGYIAHLLGIGHCEVIEEDYKNLMGGFSPDGSLSLVKNAGQVRNLGYDLTFSAPKSVSILDAYDEHGIIYDAHYKAVKEALRFLEDKAAYTRRGEQGKTLEKLPGLLSAIFTHFKSRAEDMQLHSHCLVLNLAIRNDLTWGTINGRVLYQWMKAAGVIYRAELAQNLRELGYSIEKDGESFNVVGVPKEICQHFSKREEQITKALKSYGVKSSASPIGNHLKLYSRPKKTKIKETKLYEQWQTELTALGFDYNVASSLRSMQPTYAYHCSDIDIALNKLTPAFFKV
ncbi:MobF family relaxase, partial [Vibrio sp. 10N.222.49.A3]|uniref:MobF family relaxase n=1 Tax=Vibrio sp. 10N.222.49.A3 TaxID=3229611 RepID=UPI00354CF817